MTDKKIKAIYGQEPQRDQKQATAHIVDKHSYAVGERAFMVEKIVPREQNLGTYGILWFDVYEVGVADPIVSMNATAVAEVYYEQEPVA